MADTSGRTTDAFAIVPANEASWDDLQTVFGNRGEPATCQCQWFKIPQLSMALRSGR